MRLRAYGPCISYSNTVALLRIHKNVVISVMTYLFYRRCRLYRKNSVKDKSV